MRNRHFALIQFAFVRIFIQIVWRPFLVLDPWPGQLGFAYICHTAGRWALIVFQPHTKEKQQPTRYNCPFLMCFSLLSTFHFLLSIFLLLFLFILVCVQCHRGFITLAPADICKSKKVHQCALSARPLVIRRQM